ncbi:glycosyltransferase family 2 protein [Polynucleobacter paneuropaeus]|nr:glycosyltransferase family 2 protein [Polynucleobacter paneuropaeus]
MKLSSNLTVTISIVSHGHGSMVIDLLNDIQSSYKNVQVILTLNIPESKDFKIPDYAFPLYIIQNALPKGFGANHNAAFMKVNTPLFLVLNPDVRIGSSIDFSSLEISLQKLNADVLGAKVVDSTGNIQDSARFFPTIPDLIKRTFFRSKGYLNLDYDVNLDAQAVDWVVGMFMLFSSEGYRRLGGFNEKYFLYFEDVEICQRIKAGGRQVIWFVSQWIEHDAQRDSKRRVKYTLIHIKSALRYFLTYKSL